MPHRLYAFLLLSLGLLLASAPAQAQTMGQGPVQQALPGPCFDCPLPPPTEDCNSINSSWGSGNTLVTAFSESCVAVSPDDVTGSSISAVTSCPPGWTDLWHSVSADLLSPAIIWDSGQAAQSSSGTPAVVNLSKPFNGGHDYSVQGYHVYQIQTGNPSNLRYENTFAEIFQ